MHVSPSSSSEGQCLDFLLSAWSQRYSGCNFAFHTPMHPTKSRQAQVTLVVSKTAQNQANICENKQRVAPFRQSWSRAILGGLPFGAFCFLKTEEEASSTLVWSRDQKDKKHTEDQANVRHFELSRKCMARRMRTRECMSHFVYDLPSWPLVRDPPAYAFAARSRLIIAHQI